MTPWTRMPRASSSSRKTLSGICLPRFFTSRRTKRSSGRERAKSHTLAPINGSEGTDCHKTYFLWPYKYTNRRIQSFSEHRALTMLSITAGYNSSTLCSTIFGTLVSGECRWFVSLHLVFHTCWHPAF
jgi:hypothetical protein